MNRLLSANFMRLRKNKCFFGGMILMAGYAVYYVLVNYAEKENGFIVSLDEGLFGCILFVPVLLAVVCSLFSGTEYSDGTIRNKIIAGHRRRDIYLAGLITNIVAGEVLFTTYFVVYLCVGIPLLGTFESNLGAILMYVLVAFMLVCALAAIFTMIAMLCANKAVVAVICILSAMVLLLMGSQILSRLSEPETYQPYVFSADGEMTEMGQEVKNPNYLEGTKRVAYEFLYDFLPGGQAIQCSAMKAKNPPVLALYSAIILLGTTTVGFLFFGRKDIK